MPDPSLSVIVPTWNRADVLPRALESALTQGVQDLEVIVIDDASTDGTPEVVRGLGDDRLRYERLPGRSGPSRTRNVGLRLSKAPLVGFLDSDDEWLPGKLERQLPLFGPDLDRVDAVASGYEIVYEDGHRETLQRPAHRHMRRALLGGNVFGCMSSVVARKDALEEVGGFNEELPAFVDYDMWLRLALAGKRFASAPEARVRLYKDRSDRISGSVERRIRAQEIFLRNHLDSGRLRWWERQKLMGGQFTLRGQELAGTGRRAQGLAYSLRGLGRWPFNAWSWYHLQRALRSSLGRKDRGL